jgi:hypothetical protein
MPCNLDRTQPESIHSDRFNLEEARAYLAAFCTRCNDLSGGVRDRSFEGIPSITSTHADTHPLDSDLGPCGFTSPIDHYYLVFCEILPDY